MTQQMPALQGPGPSPLHKPALVGLGSSKSAQSDAAPEGPNWPVIFLSAYIGCQIGLLFLGATPLRLPLRIGAYAGSLLMLAIVRPGRVRHPGAWYVPLIILCCVPGFLFNAGSSIVAAAAQILLYLATLAPLFWVSSKPVSQGVFRVVVFMLWGFNVASASTGVLQTYYPGQFQGQISTVLQERGTVYLGSMTVLLDNGQRVFRPLGLTDQPGGASVGGLYAILLGVGLMLTERRWSIKVLAAAGMLVGLFIIFMSHIRVTLVMAMIGLIVINVALLRRGDFKRVVALVGVTVAVALVGTLWAFAVGGQETVKRFSALTETSPTDVYTSNRGNFLEDTFTKQIFEYPMGAGAGRWGMIAIYFGNPATGLYAEIMWTAWLYDGGVLLMLLYAILLGVALWTAWRIGTDRRDLGLSVWGAVVLAYDVAAVAGTFDAPVFGTQAGLELWFLNACLFGAYAYSRSATPSADRRTKAAVPAPRSARRRPPATAAAATA